MLRHHLCNVRFFASSLHGLIILVTLTFISSMKGQTINIMWFNEIIQLNTRSTKPRKLWQTCQYQLKCCYICTYIDRSYKCTLKYTICNSFREKTCHYLINQKIIAVTQRIRSIYSIQSIWFEVLMSLTYKLLWCHRLNNYIG